MTIETVTQISDLNPLYPVAGDAKSEGDNHIRNIKTALKTSLPNVAGAMTASHTELNILDGATLSTAELNILDGATVSAAELNILDGATLTTAELNHVDGVTSPIQTQLNAKAPLASPALTGTPTAPTAAPGTNTTQIATMAALQQQAFSASLPAMSGNSGRFLSTDGTTASWTQAPNQVIRSEKTGAYTAVFGDRSALIDLNGTFTLSFTACATLGSGWYAYLRNIGSGTITLDPNGAETVDGLTTTTLHPGETRIVQCDGTLLRTAKLGIGSSNVMHVQDQKASGTAGGTSITGAQNRELNTTLVNTIAGASLASNLVTLPAGTYKCRGVAPCGTAGLNKLYIYNNTDSTYLLAGNMGNNSASMSVEGFITLTGTKEIALRHYASSGTATTGLGAAANDTRNEVYGSLIIEKVA